MAHAEPEIRRAWTYVGVPELRSAYDPPFEQVPSIALPYVSAQLAHAGLATPRIESRVCPSRPYCIFPREVLQTLRVSEKDGVRARDPEAGELKLILLDLKVFGDDGSALTTRTRIGWPLEKDAQEPVLGSFGFFSAFEVSYSPRSGIRIRPATTKT